MQYFLLFLFSIVTAYLIIELVTQEQEEIYLQETTNNYLLDYTTLYSKYKAIATLVYDSHVNTPETLQIFDKIKDKSQHPNIRKQLYSHLFRDFEILKSYNIKQFHFHLPNSESFLRFHKPERFGDSLSTIRSTVNYVNKTHEPIDGFEEGRVSSGYRFVFPLLNKDIYIGSVEISFDTFAIVSEFINNYGVESNFLIFKEASDNKIWESEKKKHIQSPFEDFYFEKNILTYLKSQHKNFNYTTFSQATLNYISHYKEKGNSFSLYDKKLDQILTFIQIRNPIDKNVVALFVVYSNAYIMHDIHQNKYTLLSFVTLLISTILLIFYRERKQLAKARKQIIKEVAKNRKKDEKMLQQSHLVQMGEMISMIAHQWRQPLAAIASTITNLQLKIELQTLEFSSQDSKRYLTQRLDNMNTYVHNLTTTIDDFRSFYKPSKQLQKQTLQHLCERSLNLMGTLLNNITVNKEYLSDKQVPMYENELMQVLVNLLKNSYDNFKEQDIKHPIITIRTFENTIEIEDNGGGIDEEIIDKVFNPYFSTKDEKNGTGLGLYMSKVIVEEHHKGIISVQNTQEGTCFRINLSRPYS